MGAGSAQQRPVVANLVPVVLPLEGRVAQEQAISEQAHSQVELLNQQLAALRQQIGALESALDVSETCDRESQAQISDLGRRLRFSNRSIST